MEEKNLEKDSDLLKLSGERLLEEFGLGNPTPGSGSASALQAMLSAKLTRTVALITAKDKFKPDYDKWLPEFARIVTEIDSRVFPEMKVLFQHDTDRFKEYMQAYAAWKKTPDEQHLREMLDRLKVVTESALEIAKLSNELCGYGAYAFEHGYDQVRGDSAVSLNAALAGLSGCIAIVELNLTSFDWNEWAWEVREELAVLKSAHHQFAKKASQCIVAIENENLDKHQQGFEAALGEFRSGKWEDAVPSEKAIEKLARDVQNTMWMYHDLIWQGNTLGSYLDILNPQIVLEKMLGYECRVESLGRFVDDDGREYATAGEIDKKSKLVRISKDMRPTVQNFTTAHELGHALLHKDMVLHRDRPLDGPSVHKDIKERQADKFAAFFLMPAKQVIRYFKEMYGVDKFEIDQNSAFKLGESGPNAFRKKVENVDQLAFFLANNESYGGRSFRSLAEIFKVSSGAMAIRLKELDLVTY